MSTCYEKPHYRRKLGGGHSDKPSPQERAPINFPIFLRYDNRHFAWGFVSGRGAITRISLLDEPKW
jgi:hypothetical protein